MSSKETLPNHRMSARDIKGELKEAILEDNFMPNSPFAHRRFWTNGKLISYSTQFLVLGLDGCSESGSDRTHLPMTTGLSV
jgi:hypothetical protein